MSRDERRIARKCHSEFVGFGSLYAKSGLPEKRFFAALRALLARGALIDAYSTNGTFGYAYKVRR